MSLQGPIGLIYHILLQNGTKVCSVRGLNPGIELCTPTGKVSVDLGAKELIAEGLRLTLDTPILRHLEYFSGFTIQIADIQQTMRPVVDLAIKVEQ